MKYNIIINGETSYTGMSKKEAIEAAKKEAEDKRQTVYVEWFRASDGQHGYLNPGGDHDITGLAW